MSISLERKAQKAFGLRDSRDILEKLRWELNSLSFRERHHIAACQNHAFNCAVTAWHTTDWLWNDLTTELRLAQQWNELRDFQNYVRNDCPALTICEQIANGSKHCLLEYKPDNSVSASISDGEGYNYGNPIIVIGDTSQLADNIFYEALFWFERFYKEFNIFPEEPFIPRGD